MSKTILILAANPKDTSRLRLDQEVREIDNGLQRAQRRDEFVLKQVLAARPIDVRRAMLDLKPSIVHFCGHAAEEEGIAFEDETGNTKLVSAEALADFFKLFADKVECVVLNACYSEIQAKAIARHINYVIGMKKGIGDTAAIAFAVGFYDALGAGEPIEFAYRLACNAIQWAGVSEHLTPILKHKRRSRGRKTRQEAMQVAPVKRAMVDLPESEIWEFAVNICPELQAERENAFEGAVRKCKLARALLPDVEGAIHEIYEVDALIALTKLASKLDCEKQYEVLSRAIKEIEASSLYSTVSRKHRALILAATLLVLMTQPFRWMYRTQRLGPWIDGQGELALGDHWLIALGILNGDDVIAETLAIKGQTAHSGPKITDDDLEKLEHATLNVAEGLRTYLVAAWEMRHASTIRSERISACLTWIDFGYFPGLRTRGSSHELRLLLTYVNLLVIGKVWKKLKNDEDIPARLSDLTNQALENITYRQIRDVAIQLRSASEHTDVPWHLESTYLHSIEDLMENDEMQSLQKPIVALFRVMVECREKFSGAGWNSWVHNLIPFGLTSGYPAVEEIAKLALSKYEPPKSDG